MSLNKVQVLFSTVLFSTVGATLCGGITTGVHNGVVGGGREEERR